MLDPQPKMPQRHHDRPRSTGLRAGVALAATLGLALAFSLACKRHSSGGGQLSQGQADQYLDRALKKSTEGVVFFPSESAQREFDMQRLSEVAQELRTPFALCFVKRAIDDIRPVLTDGEFTYEKVPEGQVKVRARISQGGTVVATEVIDSGFRDEWMVSCIQEVISEKRFPPTRSGFNKHIDIVYWVGLGFFAEARSERFLLHMRREQTQAGLDARTCLEGRIAPGHYEVTGLNLFDRKGNTIANRLEPGSMDPLGVQCLTQTFKKIRVHEELEAFIRPASPLVIIDVAADGKITIADEQWLRLLKLEEAAQREEKRRELLGSDQEQMDGPVVPAGPAAGGEPLERALDLSPVLPTHDEAASKGEATKADGHDGGGAIQLGLPI